LDRLVPKGRRDLLVRKDRMAMSARRVQRAPKDLKDLKV
jgi:hypothetical protein